MITDQAIAAKRFFAALDKLFDVGQDWENDIVQEILPDKERTESLVMRSAEVCGMLGNMTAQLIVLSRRDAKGKLKQGRS